MKYLFIYIIWMGAGVKVTAQQKNTFSLEEVISLAQDQSPRSRLLKTQKEIATYQFLSFKSELNPQVSFYGNVPSYNKEYLEVRQPDGTILFQPISQNNSSIGFSLSQQLPFSGGELSLNTDLTRFDDFNAHSRQYSNTPVFLRLSQPLFAVNQLKYQKKIETLKLEESRKEYRQEMENIAQQAAKLYFDVLDAKNNMEIAGINLQHTTANYSIEQKRIDLGTTTEDRLLQLELQMLRSKQELEKAKYDFQITQLNLKVFVGRKSEEVFNLSVPESIPQFEVDLNDAYNYVKKNAPEFVAFERKKSEAQKDVALARAAKQEVNLVASYGLNNASSELGKVYQHANDQQRFSIGFNMPIVDWGRRKARYNTARAMEKLALSNNELEEISIFQQVTTLVSNLVLLKSSIILSHKTDSVALRRFIIADNLYQIGKLSVTDLNLAQSEKDDARRSYIAALRAWWDAYYLLRRITGFDFEHAKIIS